MLSTRVWVVRVVQGKPEGHTDGAVRSLTNPYYL